MLEVPAVLVSAASRKELTTMAREPYTTGDLATAFLQRAGVKRPYFQDPFTTVLSPIMVLVSWIYHLPILHRKALLDACRIQAPIYTNKTLAATFSSLAPVHVIPEDNSDLGIIILYPQTIASLFENIYPFPSLCSLVSYFVRAENTIHKTEFLAEKDVALDKELSAALFYNSDSQVLDYTGLLGTSSNHLHGQLPGNINWRLSSLFSRGISQISQQLSRATYPPILPAYNARKNVSYDTCRNYYEVVGTSTTDDVPKNVTTLDLLKHYYLTGNEVHGMIEMRLAWFFNDLKPRIYYCLGGTDFFNGIFIQQVANLFVDILPSTNPFTRFTVSRIGSLAYDELLVTYDYSSFTTSLAELKFFLFWLAEAVGDLVVPVLDVFHGVQDVRLKDLLHTYNEQVNQHQMFSVERFQQCEEFCSLHQGRSGSLGVKGNIVFSTTLHGLALADSTGLPDADCCVGDDALCRIRAWYLALFIQCVNNLGGINPTKFITITPKEPDTEVSALTEQFKFLKRPLNLDATNTPVLGRLDFFPSVADALFPEGDGVHTTTPGYNWYQSAKTFSMQVGRFYAIHCNGEDITILARDEDLEGIIGLFQRVYLVKGLPIEGGVPGCFNVAGGDYPRRGDFFCPPVDTIECFTTRWMEVILYRFYGQTITLPVTVGGTIPPPLDVSLGCVFRASSDVQVLALLVDLGVLEKTVEMRQQVFDGSVCDEVWERLTGQIKVIEPILCTFEVVSPPPSWWYDVVSYDYPLLIEEDPADAWERLSTVYSFE